MKVRKAIIPAAGLGTRFLPATKAQPKEMLPIVDKPTIQYIVEEAVASGIEDIIIVTGRSKRAIEDHFDKSYELEAVLSNKKDEELLGLVQDISNMVDIHYIRQKEPRGLGHAIYCARNFIGNEPFAVLLGDDLVVSEQPGLKQLMDVYDATGQSTLAVFKVPMSQVHKYGIVKVEKVDSMPKNVFKVMDMVEKPSASDAPSDLAIFGRYIILPEIFRFLENAEPGSGGEIQLTDALKMLLKKHDIYAKKLEGKGYDVGDKLGFLRANIEFALRRGDMKDEFVKYLKSLGEKEWEV
ncbi:MAG: UTP--glucose-1-phosphate uridylyltransferase GalU [Bacillota bacterium]|nr:UTP--glucose-1-phosphate uridylyltransferase GalU [Bacillota bacterium]